MRSVYINIILMLLGASLTACSTLMPGASGESSQAKPASSLVSPTDGTEVGTPSVQEATGLAETTDSDVGGTSIGGAVEQAMDEADKSKMLHAMDKAPGKSTHWVNTHSQIEYTVTPTKKVRIQDKSYCRQYEMTALYANQREQNVQGVACIASDGNWHTIQN